VDEGKNEVMGCPWSTMNHQERERERWLGLLKEREEVLWKTKEVRVELR